MRSLEIISFAVALALFIMVVSTVLVSEVSLIGQIGIPNALMSWCGMVTPVASLAFRLLGIRCLWNGEWDQADSNATPDEKSSPYISLRHLRATRKTDDDRGPGDHTKAFRDNASTSTDFDQSLFGEYFDTSKSNGSGRNDEKNYNSQPEHNNNGDITRDLFDSTSMCESMVSDSSFDSGAISWSYFPVSQGGPDCTVDVITPGASGLSGDQAVRIKHCSASYKGLYQDLNASCLTSGTVIEVVGKFRLVDDVDLTTGAMCDVADTSTLLQCPKVIGKHEFMKYDVCVNLSDFIDFGLLCCEACIVICLCIVL